MDARFVSRSAVFVALRDKEGKVLLHRRANTGFMDGRYDLPSGHVEKDEPVLQSAARELQEETGISVAESGLRLWHINQFAANGEYYYNFFFVVDDWEGEPTIMEPQKCDDMQFFALDTLPKLTAGSHVALAHIGSDHVTFGYIDQAVFEEIAA
ncbi:MAG TPA: NUDIX domain-containing protein [Candidatus Saccharimonadales bacterium]|nr:NUDIX domain-containing protein [Candidatus Saccharimonadales bacterium]